MAVAGANVAVYLDGGDSTLDEGATGEDGSYALSLTAQRIGLRRSLEISLQTAG